MNKILKDIIVKSKTLSGYDAPYIPTWDCHGLPIELQVEKNKERLVRKSLKIPLEKNVANMQKAS